MSTSTLLIGYYYGLLLKDVCIEQLITKMCSSDLLTVHDKTIISTGYSGHQQKYILLEISRHLDAKNLTAFCKLVEEFNPNVGMQLNKGMQAGLFFVL